MLCLLLSQSYRPDLSKFKPEYAKTQLVCQSSLFDTFKIKKSGASCLNRYIDFYQLGTALSNCFFPIDIKNNILTIFPLPFGLQSPIIMIIYELIVKTAVSSSS